MKKIFVVLITLLFVTLNTGAATIPGAIAKYKARNFAGCMNDLQEVAYEMDKDKSSRDAYKKIMTIALKYDIKSWKNGGPNTEAEAFKFLNDIQKYVSKSQLDKFAYIYYYLALSAHQMGGDQFPMLKELYYAAAAFGYASKSKIFDYSLIAASCLENPGSCKASDMEEFIQSGKQVSDDIVRKELQDNLRKHQENINKEAGVTNYRNTNSYSNTQTPAAPTTSSTSTNKNGTKSTTNSRTKNYHSYIPSNEKLAWADEGVPTEVSSYKDFSNTEYKDSSNDIPTDEEIGKAIRTLQKAGINPTQYMLPNQQYNNEYAQLNALLNDNNNYNNNSYNQMTPYMMNNNNSQKITPEMMQIIMRQQMMGGYGSF